MAKRDHNFSNGQINSSVTVASIQEDMRFMAGKVAKLRAVLQDSCNNNNVSIITEQTNSNPNKRPASTNTGLCFGNKKQASESDCSGNNFG